MLLARPLHWQHDPAAVEPLPSHPRDAGRGEALRGNIMLPDTSTGLFQVALTQVYVNGKNTKESLK